MAEHQKWLGEILIEQGLITEAQMKDAMEEQKATGRFLGEILAARNVLTEEQIAQALSAQLGVAYVDLQRIQVELKAVELIPEEIAKKYDAMPLFIARDTITIAMANALDVSAIDELQSVSGLRVRPVFACLSAIRGSIERQYRPSGYHDGGEITVETPPAPKGMGPAVQAPGQWAGQAETMAPEQVDSLRRAASLSTVVETVNKIITDAIEAGASDIHFEAQREKLNCRYRIDGILHSSKTMPGDLTATVISRIKIMANLDIAEKRLPQDGRIRIMLADRDVDLRISTFPGMHGENVVIRILDKSSGVLKLDQLGFSKEGLKRFRALIERPYGIILVTGPTGSGKTTTLYAALNEVDSVEQNIITIEDPVEYEMPSVRQSQINVKAGLTFATGLRSIMRQDPDIIMVGEIRDKETADIAIHAALTGHLVFSTLHTNDAPSAATRLIDMGVEPFLVSSSVIGILAQRLVRTLCPSCKKALTPDAELLRKLGLDTPPLKKKAVFYEFVGCAKCKQRGYMGRTAIYELMTPNDTIKRLISQKSSSTVLRDEAIKNGMQTLRQAGVEKIAEGITSVSEILRVTEDT